jgi:hypothetical protein
MFVIITFYFKKKKLHVLIIIFISEFDPKDKDKAISCDSILHASDISNPFKPFQIYEPWAKRVLNEFWEQVSSD